MGSCERKLTNILSDIAKNCGLKKWQYNKSTMSESIENYFAEFILVSITGIKDGKETNLQLAIKVAPVDHQLRECGVVNSLYCKELYVYSNLIKDFKNLKTNIDIDEFLPKCYFADATPNAEVIVMENMISKGYARYEGGRFLTAEHVEAAMEAIAQFHALSIVLKLRDKATFNAHKELLKPTSVEINPLYLKYMKDAIKKCVDMFNGTEYAKAIGTISDKFEDSLKNEVLNANCMVFGHGDFWKENVLFKHENGKPTKACLVDFQGVRLMSAAFDVLCFLLNSMSSRIRRLHYHELLNTYYGTLQKCLKENGIEGQRIYTNSEFMEDLKSIYPFCFVCVQSGFSLWLGLENTILTSKNLCQDEIQKQETTVEFKCIIENIIEDLHYFGYLDI